MAIHFECYVPESLRRENSCEPQRMTDLVIRYLACNFSGSVDIELDFCPLQNYPARFKKRGYDRPIYDLVVYGTDPAIEWSDEVFHLLCIRLVRENNPPIYTIGPLDRLFYDNYLLGDRSVDIIRLFDSSEARSYLPQPLSVERLRKWVQQHLDRALREIIHRCRHPYSVATITYREAVRLACGAWLEGLFAIDQVHSRLTEAFCKESCPVEPFETFEKLEPLRLFAFPNRQILPFQLRPYRIVLLDNRYMEFGLHLIMPDICRSLGLELIHYRHYEELEVRLLGIQGQDYANSIACILLELKYNNSFSGYGYIRKLRERLPTTAIIVFTLYEDLHLALSAFELGANDYIPKTRQDSTLRNVEVVYTHLKQTLNRYSCDSYCNLRCIWSNILRVNRGVNEALIRDTIPEPLIKHLRSNSLSYHLFNAYWSLYLLVEFIHEEGETTSLQSALLVQASSAQYRLVQLLEIGLKAISHERHFRECFEYPGKNPDTILSRFIDALGTDERKSLERVYYWAKSAKHTTCNLHLKFVPNCAQADNDSTGEIQNQNIPPSLGDLMHCLNAILRMIVSILGNFSIPLLGDVFNTLVDENGQEDHDIYLSTQAEEYARLSGFSKRSHRERSEDAATRFSRWLEKNQEKATERMKICPEICFLVHPQSAWREVFNNLTGGNKGHIYTSLSDVSFIMAFPLVLDFSLVEGNESRFLDELLHRFRYSPIIVLSATSSLDERSMLIQQTGTFFFPKDPDMLKTSSEEDYAECFFKILDRCAEEQKNKLWNEIRNAWVGLGAFERHAYIHSFSHQTLTILGEAINDLISEIDFFFHVMDLTIGARMYHRRKKYRALHAALNASGITHAGFYITVGRLAEAAMRFLWFTLGKEPSETKIKDVFRNCTGMPEIEKLEYPLCRLWDARNAFVHPKRKGAEIPDAHSLVKDIVSVILNIPKACYTGESVSDLQLTKPLFDYQ